MATIETRVEEEIETKGIVEGDEENEERTD